MRAIGAIAAILFVATVWSANFALKHCGVVSVGFGPHGPSGVNFVGLAFTFRDFVHCPPRKTGWVPAVLASNVAGIIVDSALFLWPAFESFAFFERQPVSKARMTLAPLLAILALRRIPVQRWALA